MKKTALILEKIARLTRVIRLKRHANAVAEAVGAMSQQELLQLSASLESLSASVELPTQPSGDVLDAISAFSIDRQLNSDSAIVRLRYIARWLMQTIHLTVGNDDAEVRAIYRNAVAILRSVQAVPAPSAKHSWFIRDRKKVS
jgi:hypothetical protein